MSGMAGLTYRFKCACGVVCIFNTDIKAPAELRKITPVCFRCKKKMSLEKTEAADAEG